jgi:8-oxo-dGTP pyrophosphatase MutT (NUDIX family)
VEKGTKSSKQVREFAAGGVVFKKPKTPSGPMTKTQKSQTLWLVTKSSPSELYPDSYWRLPKGWLDDKDAGISPGPLGKGERRATEEELQTAALREVKEEGGITATIVKKIGTQRIFRGRNILKFVTFYLMEWKKDLPEGTTFETEKVVWLPHDKAKKLLKHKGEKEIFDKAKEVLESGTQGVLV